MWISFGSMHEVRAFRERKKRSVWFRELVEICVVYGDRGFRGCEGVIVCDCREMRAKRQVVEGVISQIKLFNAGSGWTLRLLPRPCFGALHSIPPSLQALWDIQR